MPRPAHAPTEERSADLATEFGLQLAIRYFGAEAIASLPTRSRGPNAGKPKGFLRWIKTTGPGYCAYVSGGAPAGMVVRAWIGAGPLSPQGDAIEGLWMGRRQALCGSRCLLGETNRAAWMAEQGAR